MAKKSIPADVVEAFSKLDCACVSDVLGGLGLRCVVTGLPPLAPGMKLCGPAVTMRSIPSRGFKTWASDEVHTGDLIRMAASGDVLVIDAGGRLDVGGWGSNVTRQAIRHGVAGVVIDGVCRDVSEIVELGLPMFVRGVSPANCHGHVFSTCVNTEPVQLGVHPAAIMVAPGDLVMADDDGIVVVPSDRASEILALAVERHAVDLRGVELADEGRPSSDPELQANKKRVRELEGLTSSVD